MLFSRCAPTLLLPWGWLSGSRIGCFSLARHTASATKPQVITNGGVVTLRGPVASAEEKTMVAKKAEKINGVDKVDNQLEVAP